MTTPDTRVLTTLFAHNTWANLKLLAFCTNLSDAQLDASAVGGYGSIRATLQHIISSEASYVNRANGKSPSQPLSYDGFDGIAALQNGARWTGEELVQLACATRQDTLVRQVPPRQLYEYPLASLMVQAVTHSVEHRTQIATIITQLGLEPPDMSGWAYMEEHGQLREMPG